MDASYYDEYDQTFSHGKFVLTNYKIVFKPT